jgi:OFA family oxalate/formate antiporter-like MFS transporter
MTWDVAEWTAKRVASRRWQLAACVVAMTAIASPQYAWTLFTGPLARGLDAQLSDIQVAFTLFVLAQSWLVPVLGYVMDRLGARIVVAAGGALIGVSWVGSGLANSLWSLYLCYTLGGVGVAGVYGACMGLALKWFPDRRGVATGMVVGAYGSGAALSVVPIRHLIGSGGYRTAFILWGFLQCLVLLVVAWPMMTPYSGWRVPRGRRTAAVADPQHQQEVPSSTPGQMIGSGVFYLLYLIAVLVTFGGLMVSAQLKPIAVAYGIDKVSILPGVDALSFALMANLVVAALARPFWGWLSDRIGRYSTMAVAFTLGGLAIFGLVESVRAPLGFALFSCLTAFTWGASFVLFSAAIGDAFGTEYAATNNGIHYTSKGVAAIFAGWGAAKLVEATGTWIPVLWLGVVCNCVAATLVFFVLRPMIARVVVTRGADSGSPSRTIRPIVSEEHGD